MIVKATTMSYTFSQDSSLYSSVRFEYKQLLYSVKNKLIIYKVFAHTLIFALKKWDVSDKNWFIIFAWNL